MIIADISVYWFIQSFSPFVACIAGVPFGGRRSLCRVERREGRIDFIVICFLGCACFDFALLSGVCEK